jgi:hypothetical protein
VLFGYLYRDELSGLGTASDLCHDRSLLFFRIERRGQLVYVWSYQTTNRGTHEVANLLGFSPLSVHRFYHTTIFCVCKLLTTIGRAMGCPGSMNPADARCSIDWNSASKHRFQRRCRGDSSPSCGRHTNSDGEGKQRRGDGHALVRPPHREPSVRSAISATYDEPGHAHSGI